MVKYTHVAVCSLARSLPAKGCNSPPCLSGAPEERLSPCPDCSRRWVARLWASQAPQIPRHPGSISPPPQNESRPAGDLLRRGAFVPPLTPVKSPSHLEQKQVHPETQATQTPPLVETVSGNIYGKEPAAADSSTAITHLTLPKTTHTHKGGDEMVGKVSYPKPNRLKCISIHSADGLRP